MSKPHSHFIALFTLPINIYELLHSNYVNIVSYLFPVFVYLGALQYSRHHIFKARDNGGNC